MIRDGYGFSMDIIPKFVSINNVKMNRTELRIHPDGNNPGSAGCIALAANKDQLNDFYLKMTVYIKSFKEVELTVSDCNNPNVLFNRNSKKKKINE
ncbi:hypothetical protein ABIB40_000538 [Pedobacter sp. UYP30]|uniref:hypothetical protein n=1 Tax=Pedobacter sp. UYP30 TaxID=1756400 RepID=UPI003392DB97